MESPRRIALICRCVILGLLATPICSPADVIVAKNGERLIGKVIQETPESVVFESESYGRVTIPRERVHEIQRLPLTTTAPAATKPALSAPGLPAGVGTDGFDWLELRSGEWLNGELKYVQQKRVEIESNELDRQKFEFKDVRRIYPAGPMYTKFKDGNPLFAPVAIEGELVTVDSVPRLQLPRDQLIAITPGGRNERDLWTGDLSLAFNLQAGNTRQADLTLQASAIRRTPESKLDLEYLQNFSIVDDVENARNMRINAAYDIFLDSGFFIRPIGLEYYRDPLANIEHRLTGSVSLGYNIFDEDDLNWTVAIGPSFQKTWFLDVSDGQDRSASSPGAMLQTKFKKELTRDIDLLLQYNINIADADSGGVSHHAEATAKFKITRSFDTNISLIWDRLSKPHEEADGDYPRTDDLRLNIGVGLSF